MSDETETAVYLCWDTATENDSQHRALVIDDAEDHREAAVYAAEMWFHDHDWPRGRAYHVHVLKRGDTSGARVFDVEPMIPDDQEFDFDVSEHGGHQCNLKR